MISFNSVPSDEDALRVAANVSLRLYPEQTLVPVVTKLVTTTLDGVPTTSSTDPSQPVNKVLQVTPQTSLADRWFALVVSSLPPGFTPGGQVPGVARLGAVAARFRPGSAPVVRQVRLAQSGNVEVVLSEGVVVTNAQASQLTVSAPGGGACTMTPPTIARPVTSVGFNCPASAWASARVHIQLGSGLLSPSGVPLGIFDVGACSQGTVVSTTGYATDLDFADALRCSTGCYQLTPTLSGSCDVASAP